MKFFSLVAMALMSSATTDARCINIFKVYKDKDCTEGEIKTNYGVNEWNKAHDTCQQKGNWYYQVQCDGKEVTYRQYHDPDCKHERIHTQSYVLNKCQPMGHNTFTSKSMHKYKYIMVESANPDTTAAGN